MLGKRICVGVLSLALLLAGCAAAPVTTEPGRVTLDNLCLTDATEQPPNGGGGGGGGGDWLNGLPHSAALILLAVIGGMVLADYSICRLEDNISGAAHATTVQAGVYHSGDGLFSVALPRLASEALAIVQRYDRRHDYVIFSPADSRILYTVSVSHEALVTSLDEFVTFSTSRDRTTEGGSSLARAGFELRQRQDITLDGRPAVFEVYYLDLDKANSAVKDRFPGLSHLYYLSYFTMAGEHGAAMYISWPGDCANCDSGSEAAIRTIDPRIQKFLDSFHLSDAAPSS
jgi:hypothetical protein